MFEATDLVTVLLPGPGALAWDRCSYFIGVWGPADTAMPLSAAAYPLTLDDAPLAVARRHAAELGAARDRLAADVATLRADRDEQVAALEETRRARERDARVADLRLAALAEENTALREELWRAGVEHRDAIGAIEEKLRFVEAERSAHSCYETMQRKMTSPLPASVGKAVTWTGARVRTVARRILTR
jgi:hypothetical protein